MKRDQKIWLLVGVISFTLGEGILVMEPAYNIRFRYGTCILPLAFFIAFWSIMMYALTQYMTTREIVSTLAEKIKNSKMNKEQKIWLLISTVTCVIAMYMLIMSYNGIRYKFGIYILIPSVIIAFWSFVMYCVTQYTSTREIVAILTEKAREW